MKTKLLIIFYFFCSIYVSLNREVIAAVNNTDLIERLNRQADAYRQLKTSPGRRPAVVSTTIIPSEIIDMESEFGAKTRKQATLRRRQRRQSKQKTRLTN